MAGGALAIAGKANIYLLHRNDKQKYAQCYIELVEKNPSAHTHARRQPDMTHLSTLNTQTCG